MDTNAFTAGWTERLEIERKSRCKRMREAYIAARKCAHILYDKYRVRRVYLIGSLTNPEDFHERSDIDLAVEGLPSHLYFKALAELWRELPAGLELDLIPLEDVDPVFLSRILKEGVFIDD